jgi:hypothetical protein
MGRTPVDQWRSLQMFATRDEQARPRRGRTNQRLLLIAQWSAGCGVATNDNTPAGFTGRTALRDLTFVARHWRVAIGLECLRRHPDRVAAVAFMEGHFAPSSVRKLLIHAIPGAVIDAATGLEWRTRRA